MHSGGIQYLVNHPEQFIEHSWQGNLERTSCQGTWADAIIIQAVANFLNLSNIAESNPTYFPATVVEPVDVTNALDLYKTESQETAANQANKQTVSKKKTKGYGSAIVLQITCSCHELQPQENKCDAIAIYDKFVSCSASRTALQNMCDDNDWCSHPV